jgi:hypothetical protein
MTALDLRAIARALGGEVSGRRVLAPGPQHSPKDRSLCVKSCRRIPRASRRDCEGALGTLFAAP